MTDKKKARIRTGIADGETWFMTDSLSDMWFTRKYRKHFYVKHFVNVFQEDDTRLLGGKENLYPRVLSLVVHTLTQWCVTRADAREVFARFYQASLLTGEGEVANACLATLTESHYALVPDTIIAASTLCAYDYFSTAHLRNEQLDRYHRRQPDVETIAHIVQLVNRAVTFFLSEGVTYTPIGTQSVNPAGYPTKLAQDTLWGMSLDAEPYPCYQDKLSLLIALIMLRDEGKDPHSRVNYIGLFNPRYNLSRVMNIRKLDSIVYRDIVQRICG